LIPLLGGWLRGVHDEAVEDGDVDGYVLDEIDGAIQNAAR
jgi:hypothetical protein